MKLYAPAYYKEFTCIADKCRHSCCIGWEIDVDEKTLKKYKRLGDDGILSSINREETPHFCLGEGERCPHLDERGLCRIICQYGDGYLCDICREHPRFYNDTARGREVGLGMSCEEACRIILAAKDPFSFEEIGKERGRARRLRYDALAPREWMLSMLSNIAIPYTERLDALGEVYGIKIHEKRCKTLLSSLEYMEESNGARFCAFSTDIETPPTLEDYLLRALVYFIYRHVTAAQSPDGVRLALGFSLLCERLLCFLAVKENATTLEAFSEIARTLSEELEYSEENTERLKLLFL